MVSPKTEVDRYSVVSPIEASRRADGMRDERPVTDANKAVENARRDQVMASAERVMRKHRATFAALAK